MGAALLAGSVAGADAREAAPLPPIAFTSSRSDHDLIVMRIDGSHRGIITASARDDRRPAWSPDGTRVAFSHLIGSIERLDVLDLRTGKVKHLGHGSNADWAPRSLDSGQP